MTIAPTRELSERKLVLSSGYKYVLTTDIAQFFPSIYTHSLAWALYGKAPVKAALAGGPSVPGLGDKLDAAMRHLQSNQTIGIPIGPDISHIFAEIIATAVDVRLTRDIPALVGFRYVDDYVFYFDDVESAEACLATLTKALSEFELSLNAAKTSISSITGISSDHWTHELKSFSISARKLRQKRDINHFFDLAYFLARQNGDENVMKFALRKLAAHLVHPENWTITEAHLLRAAIVYPNTLIDVARFIYTYRRNGYSIGRASVQKTVQTIVAEHAPLEHHSEVAWALWIAAVVEVTVTDEAARLVCSMRSSPCQLLIHYLHRRGLCSTIDNKLLVDRSSQDDLYGDLWLAVYESRVQGFYAPTADVLAGTFFGSLRDASVKFFDFNLAPKPLFTFLHGKNVDSVFLENGTFSAEDVEFDDAPEDYADEVEEDPSLGGFEEEEEDPLVA